MNQTERRTTPTHYYIVSNLGNCIIERLDRRLCKYIYTINCIVRILLYRKLCKVNYCFPLLFLQISIYIYITNIIWHTLTGTEICHLLQIRSVVVVDYIIYGIVKLLSNKINLRNSYSIQSTNI